jgi:putative phage-type endonuclease
MEKEMNAREQWLEERRKGIGGSDMAAVLGVDPYRTARELYAIKTGELPENPDTSFTRAGRALEAAIAELATEEYKWTLRQKHVAVVHKGFDKLQGHVDRTIVGEKIIVELKSVDQWVYKTSGEYGEPGTDQVPQRYLLQVATYMACFDYPLAYVVVLVGGNRLVRYEVRRDAELESMILDGAREFWGYVERGEPPPLDYQNISTLPLLRKLYPGTDGSTITLDDDLLQWHRIRMQARQRAKEYEAVADGCDAHLLEALGQHAIGELPDGSGSYRRKEVTRKAYEVAETRYMDFRFIKPKADKGTDHE